MEENVIIGEQPECLEVHTVATDIDNGNVSSEGSPLGKFKDSTALLGAYNELQSEFTRKCQKLSEVEKKLQEQCINTNTSESVDTKLNEFAWNTNISEFLQSHKNASDLVEEITNEIIKDETLRTSVDGLEKAYARVIENKYTPQSELVKNPDFLEKYIYSNDEIKNKIIKEYVSTLKENQSPISINNSGFDRTSVTGQKFSSLAEAKKYVENMFRF